MAGDNEAAEWYLTKSAEVGSVEGMMALIDFLRDKEVCECTRVCVNAGMQ